MRVAVAMLALCVACGPSLGPGQRIAALPDPIQSLVSSASNMYAQTVYDDIHEIDPFVRIPPFRLGVYARSVSVFGDRIFLPTIDGTGVAVYDASGALVSQVDLGAAIVAVIGDADHFYWLNYDSTRFFTVHAVRADGTGAVDLGPGYGLIQDDMALYWIGSARLLRASKVDFSTQQLSPPSFFNGFGIVVGGDLYWADDRRIVTTRVDGTLSMPLEVAALPGTQDIRGLVMLDGLLHAVTSEVVAYYDASPTVLTAHLFEIQNGMPHEIARIENTTSQPVLTVCGGRLFWAAGREIYRAR